MPATSRVVFLLVLSLLVGCQAPTPPTEAPHQYSHLVRVTVAQAKARPDTAVFWLRNSGPAKARTLMIDLGIDYLRYDRGDDLLCVWSGEGVSPAIGYVTAPSSGTAPTDSVGRHCNIEGSCSTSIASEEWARFRCE